MVSKVQEKWGRVLDTRVVALEVAAEAVDPSIRHADSLVRPLAVQVTVEDGLCKALFCSAASGSPVWELDLYPEQFTCEPGHHVKGLMCAVAQPTTSRGVCCPTCSLGVDWYSSGTVCTK